MTDDHHHCKVCGKVCAPDQETCSKKCQAVRDQRARTRRNYTYLLYATIAILFVILVASSSHL